MDDEQALKERIESNTIVRDKPRYFNVALDPSNKFERTDKGLLVRDVILLANGLWTDSAIRTPCYYSEEVLEKNAQNWLDNGLWSRHPGGAPRSVADKVGKVINFSYSPEYKAIMGDLLFHMKSQLSRDIAEMVAEGLVNAVSVEIGGEEYYNRKTKQNEAVTIDGYGVAVVDRGACDTCLIRHKAKVEPAVHAYELLPSDKDQETEPSTEGDNTMDEELKKVLDDLAARVAAIEKSLEPAEEAPEGEPEDKAPEGEDKELAAKLDAINKALSEANDKIKMLENTARPVSQVSEPKASASKILIGRAGF